MIAGFLPDVLQGGYGGEQLVVRRGRVRGVWWFVGAEDAGVGKRNLEKLTQLPFLLSWGELSFRHIR